MSHSLHRFRPPVRRANASGTVLALACAQNVHLTIDRRMPEAAILVRWLAQHGAGFSLADASLPEETSTPGRGVDAVRWRKAGTALKAAMARQSDAADTAAERWIAAIALRLAFDSLEARILSLALHYRVDQRVERLFNTLSECRSGITRLHRDVGLIALLLGATEPEIATRLTGDGRLLASGLLHLDRDNELVVLSQLLALFRRDVLPQVDFFDQLLGTRAAEPLPWEAFAHLGREAEVAAEVIRAALVGSVSGVNILLYGPPGTGKTSFAATLATRVGGRLRPVAEADEDGDEPTRYERLAGLRLAQRLAEAGRAVLLFDEAEDLFVRRSRDDFSEPVTSSRVFMHRLLERMTAPVIWTANDITVLVAHVIDSQ
jgi:transitional endoplasmic reticulum ATPase